MALDNGRESMEPARLASIPQTGGSASRAEKDQDAERPPSSDIIPLTQASLED
jgi:hypothetical protein